MLPSKIDQMKASQETGTAANIEFGHALMPSYQLSDASTVLKSESVSH